MQGHGPAPRPPSVGATRENERPIAVVTGGTGGIGRWIALGMARAGHHVILIGRDRARGTATCSWIYQQIGRQSSEFLKADLSLLSEAHNVGRHIAARYSQISVLINNAGVFESRPIATAEGHDRVLATNLLCPLALTQELLPLLLAGAPSRIVNVGSSTSDHARIDPDNLVLGRRWAMRRAYSQSKLALMMTTFRMANRLKGTGVVANVVHPGLVATRLVRSGGMIGLVWRALALAALTEEQGAETPLYAALAPELATVSGIYLKNRRAAPPNPRALNADLLERVWQATERLI